MKILICFISFLFPLLSVAQLGEESGRKANITSGISPIVIADHTIADLALVGKVWGFLKYYHPEVAKGKYNWDNELFSIVPRILRTSIQSERNREINAWVNGLGEFKGNEREFEADERTKLVPDFSWINESALGPELFALLNRIRGAERIEESYFVGLTPGVGNAIFKNEKSYEAMDFTDDGYKLLSLFRYWNIINYYFPYKYLIDKDWNSVLMDYIPQFVDADSELEYKLTLLSLIALVSDTHANIWGEQGALSQYKGDYYAPLEISFVESKAVVTGYFNEAMGKQSGIMLGDVIESVEGRSVDAIIKEKLPTTPASNYPTQLRDIGRDLLRTGKNTVSIEFSRGGKVLAKKLTTYQAKNLTLFSRYQKSDSSFRILKPNIAYIHPGLLRSDDLLTIMPAVEGTCGLVIDFRTYPRDFLVFSLGEYLFQAPTAFAKFSYGSITMPGAFTMTDELKVGKDNHNPYKGKIVIIVNELTQSSAEYHVMAFRAAPNAIVIGSTTAGADGNVSRVTLPGGVNTMISGIGVYYPDGTETQRVGIVPDIEVKPTINGVQEGRDELLEKAISLIRQN